MILAFILATGADAAVDRFLAEYNGPVLLSPESGEFSLEQPAPIDYLRGSLPSLEGKELLDTLREVGKATDQEIKELEEEKVAKTGNSLGFLIALDGLSPATSGNLKTLRNWANQFTTMALLSDLAAAQSEGMALKALRAQQLRDERVLDERSDPVLARSRYLKEERQSAPCNIGWKALSSLDNDAARDLLLTITGTVVLEGASATSYPPLYHEAIRKLCGGEEPLSGYKSTEEGVSMKQLSLNGKGERAKAVELLYGIQQKLLDGKSAFTEAEQKFLEETRLPIASLITLLTQYQGPASQLALERLGALLAKERVLQFAAAGAQEVLGKARGLAAVYGEYEPFVRQVEGVARDLQALQRDHHAAILEEQNALQWMLQADQALKAQKRDLA